MAASRKGVFIALGLSVFLAGCSSLWPKSTEYFQKKVPEVPAVTAAEKETQKQAADYVARKTEETHTAAISTGADSTVIVPATEAAIVADALSESIGPPESPWKKEAERLAAKLSAQQADFDRRLEAYRKRVKDLVGHEVEGTGLFEVGYFTQWIILFAVIALVWAGLKIYGLLNPIVGAGTRAVGRVSADLVKSAFTQTIEGIEEFKKWLAKSDLDDRAKTTVKEWIRIHAERRQDHDVQQLVRALTTR